MSAVDPFHPLLRVVDRYRRDVHQLRPAAPLALDAVNQGLAAPIPASLRAFLARWDGGVLFRGAIAIRSAADLAAATEEAPQIVIFADGPLGQWAYWSDGIAGPLFGQWEPPSAAAPHGRFTPLHGRFDRWLHATIRILDEDIRRPLDRLRARLDADPRSPWLLVEEARLLIAEGDTDAAVSRLTEAVQAPEVPAAVWAERCRLLQSLDHSDAVAAILDGLRVASCPGLWPGCPSVTAAVVEHAVSSLPLDDTALERELRWFVEERVTDTVTPTEAAAVEAAVVAIAERRLARGERAAARDQLLAHLETAAARTVAGPGHRVALLAAELESDLGEHDAAERLLRRLRGAGGALEAAATLALARIAVLRQEPWAEDLVAEVLAMSQEPAVVAECHLLLAERLQAAGQPEVAARHLSVAVAQQPTGPLAARVALAVGDHHLAAGDLPAAEEQFRVARAHAGDDPALLHRILTRRGDLFVAHGDLPAAARDFERAARGFSELGLPLAEGWAVLRLASLGNRSAAEHARGLFKAADHAAGVAAADAALGDPAGSLSWHLERSVEHARDRANAWRVRPPLTRADADRPERRLGAHRMAIAACDVGVVHTLEAWLAGAARSLDAATPRLSDPNLARYVAAADLLAAHRSYDAAEAFLRQLLEVRPAGAAGRALVSAMARSPNAALVDGLLEALDGGFDPAGMALAAEVLGWRREPEAVPVLQRLLSKSTPRTVRKAAVEALGRIGDPIAIDDILGLLDEAGLEEPVSTALLLLGEWQGVDSQAQALAASGARGSATRGEIVGRYGGPSYLLLLIRTAEAEGPASVGAIQGLGYLGDPRAVPHLLGILGSRDPSRNRIASVALELITGHHEDPEESLLRSRWMEWWAAHEADFAAGNRYRLGRLLDPGGLIERLDHDDPLVRRSTYDELVISTGTRLPFDAEGPWRVQRAHRRAWSGWWRDEAHRYPAGRWFFFGEQIG